MSIIINLPKMHPVPGFKLGTTSAGIKVPGRKDLVVMQLADNASVAGVFTQNAFCAAPVHICKAHLQAGKARYFVTNTGNANAGTGEQGMQDAMATCSRLAELTDTEPSSILPFSTGVIGESLPTDKILNALPAALDVLSEDGWVDAAQGILTTDTCTKGVSRQIELQGKTITITGISKGSGMIRPDMATMLAYVATDAPVAPDILQSMLKQAADRSFNRITVDGDTSTNDSCMLVATGKAEIAVIDGQDSLEYKQLTNAVTEVMEQLARAIILDGEGATKLINIHIQGATDAQECDAVAYTIAHSPLVKTAFFASDPNWGRILAAVGRSGVKNLDINSLEIYLDDVCLVRNGGRAKDYTEARGQAVMDQTEITVRVDLKRGDAETTIWTCDLSYEYVKINAEYRT